MTSGGGRLVVRYLRTLLVVVVGWIGFVSCGLAIDPDDRQHLLGDSRPLTVDVVDVTAGRDCGGSHEETYVLTYRVVGETGLREGEMCQKSVPPVGRTELWATDGGEVRDDSPTQTRVWVVAAPFLVAALITYARQRPRRRGSRD